jgi:hypothetical protein
MAMCEAETCEHNKRKRYHKNPTWLRLDLHHLLHLHRAARTVVPFNASTRQLTHLAAIRCI